MKFEDLEVWTKARALTREVYSLTREAEVSKDFGLCGQIQRAAVSTMSNVLPREVIQCTTSTLSNLKSTNISMSAAPRTYVFGFSFTTQEKSLRPETEPHYNSFTTRHVWRKGMPFTVKSILRPATENDSSNCAASTTSRGEEGFERNGIPEKLHFYNIARASNGEVRSLSYVIEDNYPHIAEEASSLRESTIEVGSLVTGLIRSTERRRE